MKKFKYVVGLLCSFVLLFTLTGCTSNEKMNNNENTISIVTTIFPEYDWTKNVLGKQIDNVELTMLLDKGVDLHNYQPSADDLMKVANCDLFIYVGGESDEWVEDALSEAVNENMKIINLVELLGDKAKEEEVVEGMQEDDHEHEHEHEDEDEENEDHDHEHEHEHEEEGPEYDEHVWLSLSNAQIFTNSIAKAMSEIDSDNSELYLNNAKEYNDELASLDNKYNEMIKNAKCKTLLFGDRFPFRYLVDDYNLDYYAAFIGCSTETNASFETIAFLSNKVDELNLKNVFAIDGSDQKIAKAIINNTKDKNQNVVVLNSMQSTTYKDVKNGASYLSIMESNLDALTEALK